MKDRREADMSLFEHLGELRRRLLWILASLAMALPVAWALRVELFDWVRAPFDQSCMQMTGAPCPLSYPSPTSGFVAYMALTLTASLLIALPMIVYQLWAFIAPGLYQRERRILLPLLLGTIILFVAGVGLCRDFVLPRAFLFLLEHSPGEPVIMVGDYLAFFVRVVLAFGLMFELPMVILVLSVAGVVTHRHLIRGWRYFVVFAFVAGAMLTPPDPASQFVLALSMCSLYALSIGIAYLFGRKARGSDALGALLFMWAARRLSPSARRGVRTA